MVDRTRRPARPIAELRPYPAQTWLLGRGRRRNLTETVLERATDRTEVVMNAVKSFFSHAWAGVTRIREMIRGDDLIDAQQHRSDDHDPKANGGLGFPTPGG